MSAGLENNPPAILVLTQVILDYEAAGDVAGIGGLLVPLAHCLRGESYTPPKTGGELNTFNRLLEAARRGVESYEKMRKRGQAGAVAKHTKQAQDGTPPAPLPDKKPAPSPAPVVRPASGGYHEIKTPAPRPAVKPSGVPAQGGACKSFGDVIGGGGLSALFGGAGGGMADKIAANPVAAALEITGETGNKLAAGALNKYLRTKGAGAFTDTVFAFYSELKNGEEVGNRGAALNARLRDLPDIPKGAGK